MSHGASGKGWFIWVIKDCQGGDIPAIVAKCLEAEIRYVVLKIADGLVGINEAQGTEFCSALKAAGVVVWGWQYSYGASPKAEAEKAVSRALEVGIDGFIADAEKEYKAAGMDSAAEIYMETLRSKLPAGMVVGLSSYRYPSLHREFPWDTFRQYVDLDMPQVYWEQSHNPAYQLTKSYGEFLGMTPVLPYVPTGSAYKRGEWQATPEDIVSFLDTALALKLEGANFWEWGRVELYVPENWTVVAEYPWPHEAEGLPKRVRVIAGSNVPIRVKPNGRIVTLGMKKQLLGVSASVMDSDNKLWYEVGADHWIPVTAVEFVD